MLHRVLTAMALVCVMAFGAEAHPNYPGLKARGDSGEVSRSVGAGKAKKAVHESRSGAKTISIARRYLGTNPTKMRRLWCHAFANMVLQKAGYKGSGSNFARSGLKTGKPVSLANARPGDLVILSRGKGGHSGFYMGRTKDGRVQLISGNTRGRVVGISNYDARRVLGVRRFA